MSLYRYFDKLFGSNVPTGSFTFVSDGEHSVYRLRPCCLAFASLEFSDFSPLCTIARTSELIVGIQLIVEAAALLLMVLTEIVAKLHQ